MLKHRLAVGIPLAVLVGFALFGPGAWGAAVFLAFCACLVVIGLRELFVMAHRLGVAGFRGPATAFSLLLVAASVTACRGGVEGALVALLADALILSLFTLTLFVLVLRHPPDVRAPGRFAVTLCGVLYAVWMPLFLCKLYFSSGLALPGRYLVLYVIAVAKIADIGAFAAGTLSAKRPRGNHKLLPSVSPKKSWEGLAGGVLSSVVCSVLLVAGCGDHFTVDGTPVMTLSAAVLMGIVFPLAGLVGDLAESYLKRASGVKDSGNIPGLGGVLDLLDSIIPVAPFFYVFVYLTAIRT